jgi:beta-glucosidase
MKRRLTAAILAMFTVAFQRASTGSGEQDAARPYRNRALSPERRAEDLLSRMTLEEKIGQMTQADSGSLRPSDVAALNLGSVLSGGSSDAPDISPRGWRTFVEAFQKEALGTRLGIPILYGIDAVHGHNNVRGAVIFPHNIGLGATRNPRLIEEVSRITALEVAATGMHWDFAPCIAVPQDERWGRTYEGFGERAELAVLLGPAAIRGLQGDDMSRPGRVLATAKHFVGDGGTTRGVDRGDTAGDEAMLRSVHMAGYRSAIAGRVGSIMVSYSSWNGRKMHGHKRLLTDVLRQELGFDGLLVSDWNGIDELSGERDADVEQAINAGIDMVMAPDGFREFIAALKSKVAERKVPMSRIDESVRRILLTKLKLGLFERPFGDASLLDRVGSPEHRRVARQAVRESLVLLVNRDNALPLDPNLPHISVGGKAADDIGLQSGGWTISWQGSRGRITEGTTVLEAIRSAVPGAKVTHAPDGRVPRDARAAVIVIGEEPYAEMKGDRPDLALDPEDVAAVRNAKTSGVPVIAVLFSGRPLILDPILEHVDALVAAWLPGSEGDGIADILFGKFNPTGRLSVTWPRSMKQLPINVGSGGDKPPDALFDYGFGLSYGHKR